MLVIREEASRDPGQVGMIHIAAFEWPDEADLVDALRAGRIASDRFPSWRPSGEHGRDGRRVAPEVSSL